MFRRLAFLAVFAFGLSLAAGPASAENRIALVIGNSSYRTVSILPNPANDAKVVTQLLTAANFEVVSAPDLTQSDMRRVIRDFALQAAAKGPDTVALIFYAGHGLQIDGENYLVPVDANIQRESDVAIETVRLSDVMNALTTASIRTSIVILDACRNNPFGSINRNTGRGLAIIDAPTGSLVAYSTAPGTEALDGGGNNSPFTEAFVDIAREPGLAVEQAFKRTRLAVHKTTKGQQTPWESTSLTVDFAFFPGGAARPAGGAVASASAASRAITVLGVNRSKPARFWRKELQGKPTADAFDLVIREDDVDAYADFLSLFPQAPFVPRVRGLLERRREMMTWYTAVTVNTALAYEAFLERYPGSDLSTTAKRLLDRARQNEGSPNLVRGLANPAPQQASAPAQPPIATPAVLPVPVPVVAPAAPCVCSKPVPPPPPEKRVQRPPPRPPGPRPPTDDQIFGRQPPPDIGPAIDIGIGIATGLGRRSRDRGPKHPQH